MGGDLMVVADHAIDTPATQERRHLGEFQRCSFRHAS
jgi:hypothetical protein